MRLKDVLNICIGSKNFDIVKNDYFTFKYVDNNCGTTLDNCYTRYSKAKESIFNEWLRWANDNDCFNFGISSYNTNIFTLTMRCRKAFCDNYLYISPTHNNFVVDTNTYKELKNIVYKLKKEFNNVLKQYDTKRVFNTNAPLYTYKKCIENEVPFYLKKYEPLFENILGLNNNICYNVINTLYNDLQNNYRDNEVYFKN